MSWSVHTFDDAAAFECGYRLHLGERIADLARALGVGLRCRVPGCSV
ncbi:hypothetical protein I552_7840 [Mycobacterium xenopi 3993]|nr:hypothetical protein I552_7840 [Mycobacterium xenopi 3993]